MRRTTYHETIFQINHHQQLVVRIEEHDDVLCTPQSLEEEARAFSPLLRNAGTAFLHTLARLIEKY